MANAGADNMQLTPIRRANIRLLTEAKGASARLAELMDISYGPLAAVKKESGKAIGSAFCRRIERALALPEGWLDTPKEVTDIPTEVSAKLNRSAQGSKRGRRALQPATGGEPSIVTKNMLQTLGMSAYAMYPNDAVTRYKEELRAIGRGFRRLIHGNPLDPETVDAIAALHVGHDDPTTALCRAYGRIVAFNFSPTENHPSQFDEQGLRIWPTDGSEWKA